MQTPKACFFDVFGTLVDWRTSIAREAEAILKPLGHSLDWLAFADAWRGEYQPAMEEIRSGRHAVLQARRAAPAQPRTHPAALQYRRPVRGRDAPSQSRLAPARRLAGFRGRAWRGSRSKCLIAPVSNGNISLMVDLARRNGFPWDAILGSEIAGDFKPKPRVYLAACEAFDLPPGDCMMVAAHSNDLSARRQERASHRPHRAAERARPGQGRAEADRAGRRVRRRPRRPGRQARPLAHSGSIVA